MLIVGVVAFSFMTDEGLATVKAERHRLRLELGTVIADRDRFSRGLARLAGLYLSAGKEIPLAEREEMTAALIRWALETPVPASSRKSDRRRRP